MTFWQDARPATPRVRRRRSRRRAWRGLGGPSRLTGHLAVAVVTISVVATIAILRSGGDADARASATTSTTRAASPHARIRPVWTGPAADWPRTVLPDGPDVV